MTDDATQGLIEAIELGDDVQKFVLSKTGQYVIGLAEQEREAALRDLIDVDAENTAKVRALQSTIKRAESIQTWLASAIKAAGHAEAMLQTPSD